VVSYLAWTPDCLALSRTAGSGTYRWNRTGTLVQLIRQSAY
jgi:hypothetical protein